MSFWILLFSVLFSSISIAYSKFNKDDYPDNWGSPVHPVEQYNGLSLKELTKNCDWFVTEFLIYRNT